MFMICGFLDVSMTPETNIIYLWRHQIFPNNSRINPDSLSKHFFGTRTIVAPIIKKNGRRPIMKVRLKACWNSWKWNWDRPENMKWHVGDMGYVSKKHEIDSWIFQALNILNFYNFDTKKPRNQETNTLLCFWFSINGFPCASQTDSHPCTMQSFISPSLRCVGAQSWQLLDKTLIQIGVLDNGIDSNCTRRHWNECPIFENPEARK